MILVAGSTDMLGGEICYILASQGKSIRALVLDTSDPAWVERLKNFGATLALGDLHDPFFLADTFVGVNEVICSPVALFSGPPGETHTRNVDLAGFISLIHAAKEADVLRFVYISYSPNPDLSFLLLKETQDIEQRLIDSGIPYTILHAGEYPSQPESVSQSSIKELARLATQALEDPARCNDGLLCEPAEKFQ